MTSRERVLRTLSHEEPDRVPFDLGGTVMSGIMAQSLDRFLRHSGTNGRRVRVYELFQMLGEVELDLAEQWEVDVLPVETPDLFFDIRREDWKPWTLFDGTDVLVPGAFDVEINERGDWLLHAGGDPSRPVEGRMPKDGYYFDMYSIMSMDPDWEPPDLDTVRAKAGRPSEEELRHLSDRASYLRKHTDKALIMLGKGWWGLGLEGSIPDSLMLLAERPDYVRGLLDLRTETAIENLRTVYDALGNNVDLVIIDGQDFGTQRAEIFSPGVFAELFAPRYATQVEWIHEHTPWRVWQHTCGSVPNLIPHLVDAGIDAINPVQTSAEGMGAEELVSRFGDEITFWGGGIDTQHTLPFGTPEDVHREVRERIETFAPGGGFVFAAIHNIQANTPPENIAAMLDALREYGEYPIGHGA